MSKHYTVMIIPEEEKAVRSFIIPSLFFKSISFLIVVTSIIIGILMFDYWKILQQIHENKHLSLENKQLREQMQLFQMKINSLSGDIERMSVFEKKLRVIMGLEDITNSPILNKSPADESLPGATLLPKQSLNFNKIKNQNLESEPKYIELKKLYTEKVASSLGVNSNYEVTRKWSTLLKNSFSLAPQYASFDYKFSILKSSVEYLEKQISDLDEFLLDKQSILKSTPSFLPVNGWITSYFGHRNSPHSGILRMHEGIDIGAPIGMNIEAPADGIVTFAGSKPGFGVLVQINHGYGLETIYAHAYKSVAKTGQKIKRGDTIAKVGNTGRSTGPHVHYEVRVNGTPVDPLYFVLQ